MKVIKLEDYVNVDGGYPCDAESFEYDDRLDLITCSIPAELTTTVDKKGGHGYLVSLIADRAKSDSSFFESRQWIIVNLEGFLAGTWRKDPTKFPPMTVPKLLQSPVHNWRWVWYQGTEAVDFKKGLATVFSALGPAIVVDIRPMDIKPYRSVEALEEGQGPCWLAVVEV